MKGPGLQIMRILIAAGIIILTLSRAPECFSCECGDLGPESCLGRADVVFEGRVESMQIRTHPLFEGMTLSKRTTTEYTVFTLKVGRVYKGAPPKTIRVATGIGTADGGAAPDCSFPFEIGREYLVYANSGVSEYEGLFSTSVCSCSGPIGGAEHFVWGTGLYLRHLRGMPPREEDKLSFEDMNKLYLSRATAQISGKIEGKTEKGFLEYGLWRLVDDEWVQAGLPKIGQDGSYSFGDLEPGQYKIGFFQLLEDGSRRIGFYGGTERLEDARIIIIGPKSHMSGIDIKLKPQSQYVIQGKIECLDDKIVNGTIEIRIANAWDHNERAATKIKPCKSFRIPGVYSGKFRVIATMEPDNLNPQEAWAISVPEIMVPEKADNVVLRLERERLSERATSLNYPIWDVWTGKVQQILDGDKIIVKIGSGSTSETRKLRIANIICPQKGQYQWEKAKELTTKLLLGNTVTFFMPQSESSSGPMEYEDSPGMYVGLPTGAADCTAKELIKSGLARHYLKYSADPELDRLEAEARQAGRGIWSDPTSPMESQSKPQPNR